MTNVASGVTMDIIERGRRRRYPDGSVVYFVCINDCVKIGFSTNLRSRMKTFRTSSADIQILLTIPGGRDLERRLHNLLQEQRIERELYRLEGRVGDFLDWHGSEGFDRAMALLEATAPAQAPEREDA
jgi:hypothetical protein